MMDFGEEPVGLIPDGGHKRKKRYHRHTPRQIQILEATFKECPHPDEKQRAQLSRELGLDPRQIKFWFQNRRTQMKTQHERADNCFLRAENDKIRCENIAMREALKKVLCPHCGAPPVPEDSYFDEQKLRMENLRLKEELDRVSSLTSKYMGRAMPQLQPLHPMPAFSSLDLTVGGLRNLSIGVGPSLDLDLLTGASSSSSTMASFSFPTSVSEMDKPIMAEMAAAAMDELVRLAQSDGPLWVKQGEREVLNRDAYNGLFPKPGSQFRALDLHVEASRDTGLVCSDAASLVDMFLDPIKWMEFFPTIVSKARTVDILANGIAGRSGSLLLMYDELHILSPVAPTREFYFLRYCQQIEQGLWAIADVSVDLSRENYQFATPSRTRRLPSGCLVQDFSNGYSKITWVEHMEIEEKSQVHPLYRNLVVSGVAFGARRWLVTLQRTCERLACLAAVTNSPRDIGGVTPEGKRSMMKLSQKMVSNFCATLSASQMHRWTAISGVDNDSVLVTVHRSTEPGQPSGVVLSAATSIWLPVSSERVFNFLKNERSQWDVLSNGNSVQEVTSIACGSHPGNCISLLRGLNTSQNSMLILQETSTDASGSLVVYSPIEFNYINIIMSGEDPSNIPLQPSSGFTILPDERDHISSSSSSSIACSSSNQPGKLYGSVVTVTFQILVSSLPSAKLNVESVSTVNKLIGTTVQQIKAALNCPTG